MKLEAVAPWSVLALLMAFFPAFAAEVVIEGEKDHYSLNGQMVYALDPTGQATLREMMEQGEWVEKSDERVLNLGFTSDPVWIRTTVRIPETTDEQWYLAVPYPLLEEAQLQILREGRLPAIHQVTREQVIQTSRHSDGYAVSLPIPKGLNGNLDLVLRANSSTSLQVPLELWREDYLLDHHRAESLYWGGYLGILFALVIYNLFLFLSLRDAAYGYYVLYLAFLGVVMLSISGVGTTFVWPQTPLVSRYALPIGTGFISLWGLFFARKFLKTSDFSARLDRTMKAAAGLAAVLIVYTVFDPYSSAQLAGLLGALVIMLLIGAGIAALISGLVIARYFVLAWTAFAAGASLYLLNIFGVLPVNDITNNALAAGSAAEVLLLSFALAHRIKEERANTIFALQMQQDGERKIKELTMRSLEQSMHDSVTGMPNTSLLNLRLRETAVEDTRLALVLVHYPQVKEIASSMGYDLAEEMFRQLVRNFNHALAGPSSIICLETAEPAFLAIPDFGSIAFLVDLEDWHTRLEPFIEQIVGNHEVSVNSVRLPLLMNLHCGVAIFPEHGKKAEMLFQHASAARDRSARDKLPVQVYSEEISAFARRRLGLMSALPPAIEAGELELFLQPQMNASGQQLVGTELLLRWNSPRLGPVPASEIIDIAENAGLIDLLSRFVVQQAWMVIRTLKDNDLDITCSINLSIQNLTNSSFTSFLLADAREQAVPMDRLIFEVTETSMMHNIDAVVGSLLLIADAGCKVALDDFGTGYSSLAYLSRLPINELKIDRCFVSQMCSSQHDLSIVENTLKLARTLNLETVAEGVEDAETLELLHRLGCHRVQGYHFARPMSLNDFCQWAEIYTIG